MMVDESDELIRIGVEKGAVRPQEKVGTGKCDPLVAVHEAMDHGQTFPKRRSFLDQVGIVSGLGSQKRGLDKAVITNSRSSAEVSNKISMYLERIIQ